MTTARSILITGASSGLGAALAQSYAAPGVTLALTGRDAVRLRAVALDATARGADVHYLCADIRDADTLHHWMIELDRKIPLDLVIANAGVSGGPSNGLESATQIKTILDVNISGVMNTLSPIIPRMIERRAGQIAIMSSLAGFAPWPGAPAYAASKSAVKTYGLALRTALRHTGIHINVICPGFIDTPMTRVNPYRMPWLMDSDRACVIMKEGLARNRALIAFPWQTAFFARAIGIMPVGLQAKLLGYAPAKPMFPPSIISR